MCLMYSHVRYRIIQNTDLVQTCLVHFFAFLYFQQISEEAVDIPISKPDADYTTVCTYPPKRLLTITPPPAEVVLRHCQLRIHGFTKEVKFTLQLTPSPHRMIHLGQRNQHSSIGKSSHDSVNYFKCLSTRLLILQCLFLAYVHLVHLSTSVILRNANYNICFAQSADTYINLSFPAL